MQGARAELQGRQEGQVHHTPAKGERREEALRRPLLHVHVGPGRGGSSRESSEEAPLARPTQIFQPTSPVSSCSGTPSANEAKQSQRGVSLEDATKASSATQTATGQRDGMRRCDECRAVQPYKFQFPFFSWAQPRASYPAPLASPPHPTATALICRPSSNSWRRR